MNLPDKIWATVVSNLGTKVVSVVIAIVLWFVVLGSRNIEVSKEIPLEIVTPSELVASNEIPEKISFKLAGPKAFLRAILDRHEEPIRVNLSGAKPGLVTYRFFADNIRLPIGVKVLAVNPTAILIKLEAQKKRDVPIKVELRGAPPEGYRISKTEVKPSTVRIRGPESRIESIAEVFTLPIDVTGLKHTVEYPAPLEISRQNIQVDGPVPVVRVFIEPVSANYRIKNVDVRVLNSNKFTIEEKTVSVLVRVDPEDLKTLDRSQVYAVVDMKDRKKGKYKESVQVTLPKNVGLVKVIPEKVNITIY